MSIPKTRSIDGGIQTLLRKAWHLVGILIPESDHDSAFSFSRSCMTEEMRVHGEYLQLADPQVYSSAIGVAFRNSRSKIHATSLKFPWKE